MLLKAFTWMLVIAGVAVSLLWIVSGGARAVLNRAPNTPNPLTDIWNGNVFAHSSLWGFELPWRPTEIDNIGVKIDSMPDWRTNSDAERDIASISDELSRLEESAAKIKTFGIPSNQKGSVTIEGAGAAKEGLRGEYIQLLASLSNTNSVSISGWSLESTLTGTRVQIPEGVEAFMVGSVGEFRPITLLPGNSVVVTSATSPVGASFRENKCVGYLSQSQRFVPDLPQECPAAAQILPRSDAALRAYGDACVDIAAQLAPCSFPTSLPQNTSAACRSFLRKEFSYNGCVERYRGTAGFAGSVWRVFLNSPRELWRNTHDTIRLLDESGRTVDVFSY